MEIRVRNGVRAAKRCRQGIQQLIFKKRFNEVKCIFYKERSL